MLKNPNDKNLISRFEKLEKEIERLEKQKSFDATRISIIVGIARKIFEETKAGSGAARKQIEEILDRAEALVEEL